MLFDLFFITKVAGFVEPGVFYFVRKILLFHIMSRIIMCIFVQVMNACVRLYADAANAKTKLENGFDLSDYDERALKFAHDYSEKLLSIDINIDIDQMLDTAWRLFAEYFTKTEVAIKEELIQKYWKE